MSPLWVARAKGRGVTYYGIDPGIGGGIATLTETGQVIAAIRMPATDRDLLDACFLHYPARAYLEKVAASPQMGVSSAFTFGRGLGRLEMALTAAKVKFDLVTPQRWQAGMQCLSGGDKNVTKRRAQQLFPDLTITHAIADALLLAEWCRRVHSQAD